MANFNIRVYGILINDKKQILVADEYIRGGLYTKFPGGGLEFGEGTRDCLKRELKEELGITVLKLKEYQLIDKQPDFLMKLFLIQEWKGTPMNLRPNEHEVVEWFSFQEASKLYFADNQYLEVLQELKRMSILKIFTANKSFLIYKLV